MFGGCHHARPAVTRRPLFALDLLREFKAMPAPMLVAVGGDDPGSQLSMSMGMSARAPGDCIVPGRRHIALIENHAVWGVELDHLWTDS